MNTGTTASLLWARLKPLLSSFADVPWFVDLVNDLDHRRRTHALQHHQLIRTLEETMTVVIVVVDDDDDDDDVVAVVVVAAAVVLCCYGCCCP